jgi:hypothetical protein
MKGVGNGNATKKVKIKGQKEPAIREVYIYGWRVLVAISVQTRLPLASHPSFPFKNMRGAG